MYQEKKKSPILVILIGIILVLLCLIVFFLWRSSSDNSKNNTNSNATPTPTATSTPTSTPTSTTTPSATTTVTPTPSVSITATPTSSVAPTGPQQVKVYYSQAEDPSNTSAPNSYKNFSYAVYRIFTSNRADIETYVMEQTISGPSSADQSNYYWFTPIKLTGSSNCGGKDFTLTKDAAANKITVQFCKDVTTSGVGDDARIKTVISYGLQPFLNDSSTKKIIVLTKDGNCLGDQSGLNTCKN